MEGMVAVRSFWKRVTFEWTTRCFSRVAFCLLLSRVVSDEYLFVLAASSASESPRFGLGLLGLTKLNRVVEATG